MEYKVFEAKLSEIYAYFQAKLPAQATMWLWYEDVKHIPGGEPLRFVVQMIRDLETIPRNMAKAFKTGWNAWKTANGDRVQEVLQQHARTACEECGGSGFIFFRQGGYRRVCRCGACRNWEGQVAEDRIPAMTTGELLGRGCKIDRWDGVR